MNKIKLGIGIFVFLTAIGTTYYVTSDDPLYKCDYSEMAGLCWKLSNKNSDDLQTRCYYNESTPTKYKICRTGWYRWNVDNFIGNERDIPSFEDEIRDRKQNDPSFISRAGRRFIIQLPENFWEEYAKNNETYIEGVYLIET